MYHLGTRKKHVSGLTYTLLSLCVCGRCHHKCCAVEVGVTNTVLPFSLPYCSCSIPLQVESSLCCFGNAGSLNVLINPALLVHTISQNWSKTGN